ncbi:P2R1A-PPP2R2A-interacting phosphatase regulator 1 isoform X2 [Oryzias latipes]
MERMEVDQCAGAGGGALRRSNSAPMITNVSDGMTVFSPVSLARFRRSSVSINPSKTLPLSPFSVSGDRPDLKKQEENMEMMIRDGLRRRSPSSLVPVSAASQWHEHTSTWFTPQDSSVTPNSSPSPTRRFRPAVGGAVRWPALAPLKRKGEHAGTWGVDSEGPPKKLFVAGVTDPTHCSSYTVSVSQTMTDSPAGGASIQPRPLSLSPASSITPHPHPGH